jgi:hypothetical protein
MAKTGIATSLIIEGILKAKYLTISNHVTEASIRSSNLSEKSTAKKRLMAERKVINAYLTNNRRI